MSLANRDGRESIQEPTHDLKAGLRCSVGTAGDDDRSVARAARIPSAANPLCEAADETDGGCRTERGPVVMVHLVLETGITDLIEADELIEAAGFRISDLEAGRRLAAIIDFGDGAWAIKQKAADLAKAEAIANRLPQGIERSVLLQAIAKSRGKGPDPYLTEEIVDNAQKAARSMSDGRRPFLLLTAAAQLANLKSTALHIAVAEAIRDFNSFDEAALAGLDWAQSIQIGPMKARFPLNDANVDFSFNEAFHVIAVADPESASSTSRFWLLLSYFPPCWPGSFSYSRRKILTTGSRLTPPSGLTA